MKKKTYAITKIFESGNHWTDVINGKTETMKYIQRQVDNERIGALTISYMGKKDPENQD